MIAIVDYGLGNVQAFANIYKRLGIAAALAGSPADLDDADRIILPGVGAFDWAMGCLEQSGMRPALDRCVLKERKPVLGVCVGMQMMAHGSDEGTRPGLGWIAGRVRRFDVSRFSDPTHLPHMGWNDVNARADDGLFAGLESAARFYFLHSYYFAPEHAENVLAETDYNGRFASGVRSGGIHGVQFHPEKSHQWGIRLLKNFAEL
jgi:imidazole glycerol-phosphate synthase subunit HisH